MHVYGEAHSSSVCLEAAKKNKTAEACTRLRSRFLVHLFGAGQHSK